MIYRAANWLNVGDTRGFRRVRGGCSATAQALKRVFVRPRIRRAQARLSQPVLDPRYHHVHRQREPADPAGWGRLERICRGFLAVNREP